MYFCQFLQRKTISEINQVTSKDIFMTLTVMVPGGAAIDSVRWIYWVPWLWKSKQQRQNIYDDNPSTFCLSKEDGSNLRTNKLLIYLGDVQ